MKYMDKKERYSFYAGLSGQNLVYSFIGASFFTYFMTDIAMFPAAVVTVLLIVMKVWDGINDPIIGAMVDRHHFKNGEKLRPFLRYPPCPSASRRYWFSLYFQHGKTFYGCVFLIS